MNLSLVWISFRASLLSFEFVTGVAQLYAVCFLSILSWVWLLFLSNVQAMFRLFLGYVQAIFRLGLGYVQAMFRLWLGYG